MSDSELDYARWANRWQAVGQQICALPDNALERAALLSDLGDELVLRSQQDIGIAATTLSNQMLKSFRVRHEDFLDAVTHQRPSTAVASWEACQVLIAKRCIRFLRASACEAAHSQEGVQDYVRRVCTDIVFLFIVSHFPKLNGSRPQPEDAP